jgi:hypothetical protein
MANNLLTIYREYLVQVAERECRPFRLPKSTDSLEKRNDYSFFLVLEKKLDDEGFDKMAIKRFMKVCQEKLGDFHISYIVDDFDELLATYKTTKIGSAEDEEIKIKKAFDFLAEYSIINNINTIEELGNGSPPTILKLWKGGKIGDLVVVKLFDLSQIRKKVWARAYCGKLLTSNAKLKQEVTTGRLSSVLEFEQLKLKNKLLTINN